MNNRTELCLPVDFQPSARDAETPKVVALAHSTNLAGAQLALASLVKNTQDQLDWTVVCPSDGPFVENVEPYSDIVVTEKYPWWCKGNAYTALPTPFHVERLNEVLDGIDYDYGLTNTITVPWLAYNARTRGRPHMWYIHEYGDLDHDLSFSLGYDRAIGYINELSDVVMTVSPSVGEHLLEHGVSRDRLRYISQSFDVDSYLSIPPLEDRKDLLILGSIKKSKGQMDALVGFHESSISSTATLTIAGPVTDSWYANGIQRYIDDNGLHSSVNFIPRRVDSVEQMKLASVVLVCSKNEALGRVTLEALAAGRVVVGSRGGGTEMLLSDRRGVLYDGTAAGLKSVLDDLEHTILLSADERKKFVTANYSPDNERNDFLDAVEAAGDHYQRVFAPSLSRTIGKTGIFNAMREQAIIA